MDRAFKFNSTFYLEKKTFILEPIIAFKKIYKILSVNYLWLFFVCSNFNNSFWKPFEFQILYSYVGCYRFYFSVKWKNIVWNILWKESYCCILVQNLKMSEIENIFGQQILIGPKISKFHNLVLRSIKIKSVFSKHFKLTIDNFFLLIYLRVSWNS